MKKCNKCNKYYANRVEKCSCGEALVFVTQEDKIPVSVTKTTTYINNTPHCPTCGSEHIRHISSTEKVGNAMMFGFLGNKRKYQFQCLNPDCKYMW